MPRPRNLVPSERINLALPGELKTRLDLYLYSTLEHRVPHAAYQRFFVGRLLEYFDWGTIDLAAYVPSLPPGSHVRGPKPLLELLIKGLTNNVLA